MFKFSVRALFLNVPALPLNISLPSFDTALLSHHTSFQQTHHALKQLNLGNSLHIESGEPVRNDEHGNANQVLERVGQQSAHARLDFGGVHFTACS